MPKQLTRRGLLNVALTAGAAAQLIAGAAEAKDTERAPRADRKSNFDDSWSFFQGDAAGAQDPSFSDGAWAPTHLPHDWSIAGPLDQAAPSGGSGGYAPTGIGWYRKRFTLPHSARNRRVAIQFDGIYQRSEVWINGQSLGLRPNGYVSLNYDLTPYLNPHGRPNLIAVRVDNSLQPNSRWYSGSGIYRHAWLVVTDPVHVAPWGVQVAASDVTEASATVDINTRVINTTGGAALCTVRAAIVDPDGKTVAVADAHGPVAANADFAFEHRLKLASPALWSLDTPQLYNLRTTVIIDDVARDVVLTPFGVRDARFDPDQGFLLNGQRVKLNGVCLHGDGGAVGTAVPERIWERRLGLLKDMGCNAIRCSHNPPAPEFLDLCDRLGLAVMGEPFDEWRGRKDQTPDYGYHRDFDEWWERDLTNMLERDRNHPSIVIWSAGNEIPDQTAPDGPQTLQALLDVFHRMDPTRLVTAACDNIAAEPHATPDAFLSKLDVVGYNYVDRWRDRREKYYSIDRLAHPTWRFIGTESASLGGVRGQHGFAPDAPVFFERSQNTRIEVEQLQKFIQTYDYVSGDFLWTGIDYLGESRWPYRLGVSGQIDTCGFPKDSFYFYQSLWSKQTVLHLAPHWNWAGKVGEIISVSCYTNCDTVELFLNDKSLGVKGFAFPRPGMITKWGTYPPRAKALQTTADLHLDWDVAYQPGVLRAVGVKDGQVVSTVEVKTTGAPAGLRLTSDRDAIQASFGDVAHVKVEVIDADGLVVPDASNDIGFALSGVGRILAVDNGQPDSHEPYQSHQRKAFNGLALALLQSPTVQGEMTLSASSPGLAGASLKILVGA